MSEASQPLCCKTGGLVKLCLPASGSPALFCCSPSLLRPRHSSCSCGTPGPLVNFFLESQSSEVQGAKPQEKVWGFDLVSTSGLKIASCPAQEKQGSLTSPLTMGKSSYSKKGKARTMSVTCQGLFSTVSPFVLVLWPMGRAILKRGRLGHSWFSDQGSEGLP